MLLKAELERRLEHLRAQHARGELPEWEYRMLHRGARVSYQLGAEARAAARRKLRTEIEAGRVQRPDRCQRCNSTRPLEGHHVDYARPLDVKWLCATDHNDADREAVFL